MNVMNGRVPICRQVVYIIVSNNIMIVYLLACMLRMLLMIAYMLVPMYMIHVVSKLIVIVVMRNVSLHNVMLIVFMNMLAVSAYADA